jgi:hypothetical protein
VKMKGMLPMRHEYRVNKSHQQYEFESEGPNGIITKVVLYQYMGTVDYVDHYNLAFADIDKRTGKWSDLTVSNNMDRNMILATVAATAVEFSDHFPGRRIYARGSTPARTRLYQMGIAAHFESINKYFLLKGQHTERGWVAFRPGYNYQAFLGTRKIYTIFN